MDLKLPIYKLVISDEDDDMGVNFLALVSDPATKRQWQTFKSEKELFQVQNEDRQILSGALMVANLPIYRRDEERGEYYVLFDKETIEKIVHKFFKNGFQDNVNGEHEGGEFKDCYMFESFLIDESRGIETPKGFDKLPDGSWFGSFKIDNHDVWNNFIKTGEFKGFSVEGIFEHQYLHPQTEEIIEEIIDIINNKEEKFQEKNKFESQRIDGVSYLLMKTTSGLFILFEDTDFKPGMSIWLRGKNSDGTFKLMPLLDGKYDLVIDIWIRVQNGKVVDVGDKVVAHKYHKTTDGQWVSAPKGLFVGAPMFIEVEIDKVKKEEKAPDGKYTFPFVQIGEFHVNVKNGIITERWTFEDGTRVDFVNMNTKEKFQDKSFLIKEWERLNPGEPFPTILRHERIKERVREAINSGKMKSWEDLISPEDFEEIYHTIKGGKKVKADGKYVSDLGTVIQLKDGIIIKTLDIMDKDAF